MAKYWFAYFRHSTCEDSGFQMLRTITRRVVDAVKMIKVYTHEREWGAND